MCHLLPSFTPLYFAATIKKERNLEMPGCVTSVDEALLNTALDMPLNFIALMIKIILCKCDN